MPRRSFLYSDVATELRSRIATGTYSPGARVPSLGELMEQFKVSAITVRRALRELTYEGLLQGHQGLGVFVKTKPRIHRVLAGDPDRSIGDEIMRAGFTPRLEEIGYDEISADDGVSARLDIASGTRILRHRKLTYANDEPVALHVLYMPQALARTLRDRLADAFIFRLLKEHDIAIVNLRCEFSAVMLGEEHSQAFDLPAGHPMMRVDYTALGENEVPLLLGLTVCRADRFVFEVDLPRRDGGAAASRRLD